MMENDSTFVAPEGVYSVTEEHKSLPFTTIGPQPVYPTKLTTVIVRFPSSSKAGPPGLTQLLSGAGKEFWKDKSAPSGPTAAKEDGLSVSSSETPDDSNNSPDLPSAQQESVPPTPISPQDLPHHHGLFLHQHQHAPKKKAVSRPKHNMRTTSSTFITRLHSAEGLARTLQAKQGEVTFAFYNSAKNLYWVEVGANAKVRLDVMMWTYTVLNCYDAYDRNLSLEYHSQVSPHVTMST